MLIMKNICQIAGRWTRTLRIVTWSKRCSSSSLPVPKPRHTTRARPRVRVCHRDQLGRNRARHVERNPRGGHDAEGGSSHTDGSDAYILIIVDDVLISETHVPGDRHPHACALHSQLEARYGAGEVRLEHEPTSFVGFTILRDRFRRAMTISMAAPIEAAAREHIPDYVNGASLKSLGIPEGKKLRDLIDSLTILPCDASKPRLTPNQRLVAQIIGKCRWYDKVSPATTHALHALSCVVSRPPPEALLAAKALLACQYDLRHTGITFGGGGLSAESRLRGGIYADFKMQDGARTGLEAVADSTWAGDNVYAILLMYHGGCVAHLVKKMHLIVDSSMESEAVATGKCGEIVSYAREILRALGVPPNGPTFVGSDNKRRRMLLSPRVSLSHPAHVTAYVATSLSYNASSEARSRSATFLTSKILPTSLPNGLAARSPLRPLSTRRTLATSSFLRHRVTLCDIP